MRSLCGAIAGLVNVKRQTVPRRAYAQARNLLSQASDVDQYLKPEGCAEIPPTPVISSRSTSKPRQQPYPFLAREDVPRIQGFQPLRSFMGSLPLQKNQEASNTKYDLAAALRHRDSQEIFSILIDACEDHDYIQSISKTTWTEILRLLEPTQFSPSFHRIHRSLNPTKLRQIGFDFEKRLEDILQILRAIVAIREEHGISPELVDYRILLSYAAQIGHAQTAKALWEDLHHSGVVPDAACYTYYMEALVWDESTRLAQSRRSLETFPPVKTPRPGDIASFVPGAAPQVKSLLSEMRLANVPANTSTLCALMTAMARDGDIEGVQEILLHVWAVDIRAIVLKGPTMRNSVQIAQTSPLYPNSKLLVTIADVFGANNNVPLALQIIDLMACHYEIPIKSHVWYRLLNWTWMQSQRDPKRLQLRGGTGMTRATVQRLMMAMVSTPYNVKDSSIDMHHLNVKTIGGALLRRPRIQLEAMTAGRNEYTKSIRKYRIARGKFQAAAQSFTRLASQSMNSLLRDLLRATMKKKKDQLFLLRWTRNLFPQWTPKSANLSNLYAQELLDWQLRLLPDFLLRWSTFIPASVRYRSPTGLVRLQFRTREEVQANHKRKIIERQRRKWFWLDRSRVRTPLWRVGEPWRGRRRHERASSKRAVRKIKRKLRASHRARASRTLGLG